MKLYSVVENYSQGIHGDDHNDANIIFNVVSTSQRLLAQRLKEIICSLSVCFILKGPTWHEICGHFPSPHSVVSLTRNPSCNNSSTPKAHLHHSHRGMGISTGNSLSVSVKCDPSTDSGWRWFCLLAMTTICLVLFVWNNPPGWRCQNNHHTFARHEDPT